jgi:hypothetical protein
MKLKLALAGALLTLGLASPAVASHGYGYGPAAYPASRHAAWELIGTRQVSFRIERDTVFAHGHERHRQLKVCAYRQPVRLFDLDVRFRNGGHQDVPVRAILYPGQCTRAIDLVGHRRDIRTVSFVYRSLPGFRHYRPAVVQVFAR